MYIYIYTRIVVVYIYIYAYMYVYTSIYNIVYINNIVYIYVCVCAYAISPQTRHSSSTLDTASRCRLECDWIAAGAIQLVISFGGCI